jgi:hypothetical protein
MHSRPGLADEMENLGNLFANISTAVKGMQTSLNVFHAAVRTAAYGKAAPAIAPTQNMEDVKDELKESVKNLEALFARIKNNGQ